MYKKKGESNDDVKENGSAEIDKFGDDENEMFIPSRLI